jgi:intracellular sulfur oxidation DsrE/DsrF family protein
MKFGIALGIATPQMAEAVLKRTLRELDKGEQVELFLVFNGVGLYDLVGKDPKVAKLLDAALDAGMTLTACKACEVVHGAKKAFRRQPLRAVHLIGLWWRSDRFIFASRLKRPEAIWNSSMNA